MQNKGFVKVFAVLLTLVCLFYLSFSFVTRHYNSKAAKYAAGDPVKESAYLDSLSTQKVWLGYTLKQCREMEISLGLDLKGGMNVVLELSVADVVRSLSNNNQDENFNKALDLAYADQATSQKHFIDLFAEEYKKLDSNARLSAIFSTFELKDKITPQSSDAQVISVLKEELQSAIDNSFNVLRTRIDRFGVVSPNIQRLETAGRILVELPGVKEPERVRKLLQGSANLEFWETYELPEIYQQLVAADNVLASILSASESDSTQVASVCVAFWKKRKANAVFRSAICRSAGDNSTSCHACFSGCLPSQDTYSRAHSISPQKRMDRMAIFFMIIKYKCSIIVDA